MKWLFSNCIADSLAERIDRSPENLYKYNGKEEQEETGWLDFNTRMHDPALGRFMGIDLLADDYSFQSPYAYAANNPIRYIDFLGMNPEDKTGDDEEKTAQQTSEEYWAQFGLSPTGAHIL